MSVREARVAGTFYPAKKETLLKTLQGFKIKEPDQGLEDVICIIAPHAGYIYSGKIAAAAYEYIKGKKIDNVIVISPSHHDYFSGCTTITDNYSTPLGEIPTYGDFIQKLTTKSHTVILSRLGHGPEHALEVHLPFLQQALGQFRLIPLVMGRQNMETARLLAEDLHENISCNFTDQKFLVICSSDLSHFYNISHARTLDDVVKEDIRAFDPDKLNSDILSKKAEACGYGPILCGMILSKMLGASHSKIVDYGTSADVNNDYNSVVGYLSALFYRN